MKTNFDIDDIDKLLEFGKYIGKHTTLRQAIIYDIDYLELLAQIGSIRFSAELKELIDKLRNIEGINSRKHVLEKCLLRSYFILCHCSSENLRIVVQP